MQAGVKAPVLEHAAEAYAAFVVQFAALLKHRSAAEGSGAVSARGTGHAYKGCCCSGCMQDWCAGSQMDAVRNAVQGTRQEWPDD